jgi:hypothetical protein
MAWSLIKQAAAVCIAPNFTLHYYVPALARLTAEGLLPSGTHNTSRAQSRSHKAPQPDLTSVLFPTAGLLR